MNLTRYVIMLTCIIFLQGCTQSSLPDAPVSVTRIQLDPEEPGWHKLEIVGSSKRGDDDTASDVSISGRAEFCSGRAMEPRDARRIKVYYSRLVGEAHQPPSAAEPDGTYRYSALISVSAEGIKGGGAGGAYDGLPFGPASRPWDRCSKVPDAQIILWGPSSWVVVTKEMIAKALALPPDPQRSAAWRRERSYGSRPAWVGSSGGFKAWTY